MEYDPSRKTNPVKHREFLKSRATFKDVLFIKDEALRNKINQTYRMQVNIQFLVKNTFCKLRDPKRKQKLKKSFDCFGPFGHFWSESSIPVQHNFIVQLRIHIRFWRPPTQNFHVNLVSACKVSLTLRPFSEYYYSFIFLVGNPYVNSKILSH